MLLNGSSVNLSSLNGLKSLGYNAYLSGGVEEKVFFDSKLIRCVIRRGGFLSKITSDSKQISTKYHAVLNGGVRQNSSFTSMKSFYVDFVFGGGVKCNLFSSSKEIISPVLSGGILSRLNLNSDLNIVYPTFLKSDKSLKLSLKIKVLSFLFAGNIDYLINNPYDSSLLSISLKTKNRKIENIKRSKK